MTPEERITELETAIRRHRDERGHDRCWLDDARLYEVLRDGGEVDTTLPPKEIFLERCEQFWECRQGGTKTSQSELTEPDLTSLNPMTVKVLWAAMVAMVMDVHSPQDMMSGEEWDHAKSVLDTLTRTENADTQRSSL